MCTQDPQQHVATGGGRGEVVRSRSSPQRAAGKGTQVMSVVIVRLGLAPCTTRPLELIRPVWRPAVSPRGEERAPPWEACEPGRRPKGMT